MTDYLLPFAAFLVVVLIIVGITGRKNKSSSVADRLQQMAQKNKAEAGKDGSFDDFEEIEQPKSDLAIQMESLLTRFDVDPEAYRGEVNMKLAQAGVSSPNALPYYVFMKKFGWVIGLLFLALLGTLDASGMMRAVNVFVGVILFLYCTFGADMFLRNRKEKRQHILGRSFPDGLDLILVCVEAGLALDAALARVCKELKLAHPVLTDELNKTRMELTLLNDRPQALQNLAERTDMMAFRSLVGALLQSERFGTSLTETLRVLSEDYRNTRMMVAENKAGKLPALMTIPLMLLMMPAFIMVIMAPAIIMLIDTYK